jgi:hypothetical protein
MRNGLLLTHTHSLLMQHSIHFVMEYTDHGCREEFGGALSGRKCRWGISSQQYERRNLFATFYVQTATALLPPRQCVSRPFAAAVSLTGFRVPVKPSASLTSPSRPAITTRVLLMLHECGPLILVSSH